MSRSKRLAFVLTLAFAGSVFAQDKKDEKKTETGPFGLASIGAIKEKVKPSEDQFKKVEEVYRKAADTEKAAKESGGDRKTIQKSLERGRIDTITQVKDILDADQDKIYDQITPKPEEPKKKK